MRGRRDLDVPLVGVRDLLYEQQDAREASWVIAPEIVIADSKAIAALDCRRSKTGRMALALDCRACKL